MCMSVSACHGRWHWQELKIVVLKLISILIESVGKQAEPYLGRIFDILPSLCNGALVSQAKGRFRAHSSLHC